jgi:hypothetical protein
MSGVEWMNMCVCGYVVEWSGVGSGYVWRVVVMVVVVEMSMAMSMAVSMSIIEDKALVVYCCSMKLMDKTRIKV